MFTCDLDYVYTVEENRLKKLRVEEFNVKTSVFIAVDKGRRIRGSLDCSMFFRSEQEALQQGYNDIREMLVGVREEYEDALASYRTARKLGRLTLEDYKAKVAYG
jgi:hypothetical protein